jgi:uncharacterized membrane protein
MSNFEVSKLMAAIGALLMFLGFVPGAGIIGGILIIIGLKGLAEYYRDDSIFRNAISGAIFGIVGFIVLWIGGTSISGVFTLGIAGIVGGLILLLILLVVLFAFMLMMALSFRKVLYALSDRSGEHLFHTAGTLMFIGAALTIVFFIGLIMVFIAWIIATIAFFSIRAGPQPQSYAYPPPPPSPQPAPTVGSETKYCPNCGAPVNASAAFCSHCGKQLS